MIGLLGKIVRFELVGGLLCNLVLVSELICVCERDLWGFNVLYFVMNKYKPLRSL